MIPRKRTRPGREMHSKSRMVGGQVRRYRGFGKSRRSGLACGGRRASSSSHARGGTRRNSLSASLAHSKTHTKGSLGSRVPLGGEGGSKLLLLRTQPVQILQEEGGGRHKLQSVKLTQPKARRHQSSRAHDEPRDPYGCAALSLLARPHKRAARRETERRGRGKEREGERER